MKAIVKEHIEQLDVKLGGGIISDKIRVDTIDNPMLVIGIGGTGIDALLRLKYQINRRFNLPEDRLTKRKKEKPDNMEFLALETNQHDRNKKYKGIGLDPINELILLSNPEIGSILQNRSILDPCIAEWLSPELNVEDGITGANGIRQAGRLLLFTKAIQVVKGIEKKINVLLEGTSQKLMVFILTGLSGGTGSGCYLDIAYMVRGLMERRFGSAGVDRVNILGYLFTPDVNLSSPSLSSHTQDYIKKNGYAALKELDYWMNVAERGERFKQKYRDVLTVDSPLPPFNLCHLISATNTDGKLLENAYDYCMNVTAENITNFMANEEKHSGEEFAIHDYISNINTNIAQMTHPYSANYKYNIIGASSAVLPIEEITTYLAYRLFKKIEKMFTAGPKENDVDDFMGQNRMNKDSIERRFEQNVPDMLPGYRHSERFSFNNVIKTQSINIDNELEGCLTRIREEYIKVRRQLPGEILEEFNAQISRMFLNADQGPFYVSRLINNSTGFCVLKTIQSYIESLKESLKRLPQYKDELKFSADDKLLEARKAIINKEKKKNDYIEAKINEYMTKAEEERTRYIIEFYEDLFNLINDANNKIYNVFTEILNALNQIFEKNGSILVSSEEVEHKGGKTYYWNVVNIPDVLKTIDKTFANEDEDDLIRNFTRELLDSSDKWIKEQDIDIVGSISDFMSDKFGDLITKSMEDFLIIKYGEGELIEKLVEKNIAKRLDDDAIPVFNLSNSDGNLDFPSWGFVSVPIKAPGILKGIKNYQTNALGKSTFTIKESEVKNRIFWLNTKNGIPLYAYTPLKIYEEAYERTIREREGIGRHLSQTKDNNWANLPSPIPVQSWGDSYSSRRIKEYNDEIRVMFDKACKLGCIREKETNSGTNNRFECIITKAFDLDKYLTAYNLVLPNEQPNFSEMKRCLTDLKNIMAAGIEEEGRRDIFSSFDKERAFVNLTRSPELIKLLRIELKKYEGIQDKIESLNSVFEAMENKDKVLEQFIEVMYTDTIYKKGAQYVFDNEKEEDGCESLINLLRVKKYFEYEIFNRFTGLDEKKKALIMRRAEKKSDELSSSEDISGLLGKVNSLMEICSACKEELEFTKDELINGTEIYDFYKNMLAKLNELRKNIE